MVVRDIMTPNPACCLPGDTAQAVARKMCENNVGSIPVVIDQESRKLTGIITDRDLCCSIVAKGLDPASTPIRDHMHRNPVSCRLDESLEACLHAMQKHQVRRIPVIDERGSCVGIVAQADVALKHEPQQVSQTVADISRPQRIAA
jgi:CBS domain-containing protein